MTLFLALDGPDGGGHSTHADLLAEALRDHGVDAIAWHHPVHPKGAKGSDRVQHYIEARNALRAHMEHDVCVMDRSPWAGVVHARASHQGAASEATAMQEITEHWQALYVIFLDAPDAILDERLRKRGEAPKDNHAEREQWRRLASYEGWSEVRTDGEPGKASSRLLLLALSYIGTMY